MSTQTSPDPELPFFRAWSLRPKSRRAYSSDIDVSPKATPTAPKSSGKATRPDHVRLPSGHFFDRIGLRDRVDKSQTTSEEDVTAAKVAEPVLASSDAVGSSPDATPMPTAETTKNQLRPTAMRVLTKSAPTSPDQKGGLYRRTMRRLGVNSRHISTKRPQLELSPPRSFTGQILDRASTILRHIPEKQLTPTTSKSSNHSTTDSSAPRSYLSPLRRAHSNSSSLRNILMGDVPFGTPTTPDSALMYMGSDQRQYFRVDISAPGAPTYLPSEARRIGTPPLLDQNGKPRGFFFSYAVRDDEGKILSSDLNDRPKPRRKRTSNIDWYAIKLKADEARDNALSFELNVPEHLPSSPLCPKHPKHKSGGKGICVYHGRNRDEADEP